MCLISCSVIRKGAKLGADGKVGKMKLKYDFFSFKCFFNRRVGTVIFELHEVTLSSFVKFKFQRLSSKIEQAFEKTNKKGRKV